MTRLGKVTLALVGSLSLAVPPCIGQGITAFSLNDKTSDFTITTCATNTASIALFAIGEASVNLDAGISYNYQYTLTRDSTEVAEDHGTISSPDGEYRSLYPFRSPVPAVSGTYILTLSVLGGTGDSGRTVSQAIKFTLKQLKAVPPIAKPLINRDANDQVAVCPGGPIVLDGSQSICAEAYFVDIELSDKNWSRLGGGGGVWIGDRETQNYGHINSFDVKRFAEDRYIGFFGGQYYRVKLAVGPVWNEHTQLIYINPLQSALTINGKTAQRIEVINTEAIRLDGSRSTCATNYFVSVQASDAASKLKGVEAMRWLTKADFDTFGQINAFDVKRFARTFATTSSPFAFVPGEYYRVKLAVGPPWNETTMLLSIIKDPCICSTPHCLVPASCEGPPAT
jgi:hypothetical protein